MAESTTFTSDAVLQAEPLLSAVASLEQMGQTNEAALLTLKALRRMVADTQEWRKDSRGNYMPAMMDAAAQLVVSAVCSRTVIDRLPSVTGPAADLTRWEATRSIILGENTIEAHEGLEPDTIVSINDSMMLDSVVQVFPESEGLDSDPPGLYYCTR